MAFVLGDGAIAEGDRAAALDLPREQVATSHVSADDEVQDKIDAELRRKYAGQAEVDMMLADPARACTLRIEDARPDHPLRNLVAAVWAPRRLRLEGQRVSIRSV